MNAKAQLGQYPMFHFDHLAFNLPILLIQRNRISRAAIALTLDKVEDINNVADAAHVFFDF